MLDKFSFLPEIAIMMLIIASGAIFVIAEIAILTSNKGKLHKMASRSNVGAKKALRIMHHPEIFLASMQIGITLSSALLGLFGGSSMIAALTDLINDIPYAGEYLENYSFLIASFVSLSLITYVSVLCEIVPKRIAMLHPEKMASATAHIIDIIMKIMFPLSWILTISTKRVLKLFKIKDKSNEVSIDEIKFVLSQAESVGTLHKTEHDLLRRLINVMNMQVCTIMTHRNKIVSLDIADNESNNISKLKKHSFNFFPVINATFDQVIGIVSIKSLLKHDQINNAAIYESAKDSTVAFIPEMATITKLIDLFSTKHVKTALVIDEYGDIEGIVTLNDITRNFLGDLAVLMDGKKPAVVSREDGSMLVDGGIAIEELFELLNISSLPDDEEEDYRTLASFILKQIGTLPKIGDIVTAEGFIFKVLKMDKKRIERVLIMRDNNLQDD